MVPGVPNTKHDGYLGGIEDLEKVAGVEPKDGGFTFSGLGDPVREVSGELDPQIRALRHQNGENGLTRVPFRPPMDGKSGALRQSLHCCRAV